MLNFKEFCADPQYLGSAYHTFFKTSGEDGVFLPEEENHVTFELSPVEWAVATAFYLTYCELTEPQYGPPVRVVILTQRRDQVYEAMRRTTELSPFFSKRMNDQTEPSIDFSDTGTPTISMSAWAVQYRLPTHDIVRAVVLMPDLSEMDRWRDVAAALPGEDKRFVGLACEFVAPALRRVNCEYCNHTGEGIRWDERIKSYVPVPGGCRRCGKVEEEV